MKTIIAFLLSAIAAISGTSAQASESVWDVSLCIDCSSISSYEAAARQVAGTDYNGEREILVINPQTKISRFVTVFYTPPDQVPYSTGSQSTSNPKPRSVVKIGSSVNLIDDPTRSIVFADQVKTSITTSSTLTSTRPATADENLEIGALIEFGGGNFVVTFPHGDFFSSFNGREPVAVANYIYQAMTAKNAGWVKQTLGNRIRQLVFARLKVYFGKSFQVCGIFNNGDSACFQPDAATPSLEHLVEGSAKTRDGTTISSGGSGGGGLTVSNNYTPNGAWGPVGSSGSSGELWLFCAFSGGKLITCWTQIL